MLPFQEKKFENKFIRLFNENIDDEELVWHRDREFRIVEVLSPGGWKFQFDNELPLDLYEGDVINIPALEWHRIIKGKEPLVVSVEKLTLEEAKKKKINKGYLKGTKKSNREMKREIKKCSKNPRPKSCYDEWEADKSYKKSRKGKKNPYLKEELLIEIEGDLNEFKNAINETLEDLFEGKISEKTRKALKNKAEKSNAPLGALTAVYRKGLAAWLTGHRQGVGQHQWAMARVNSFLSGGKARNVDKKEWAKVQRHRSK
jgi:hypothetical protein